MPCPSACCTAMRTATSVTAAGLLGSASARRQAPRRCSWKGLRGVRVGKRAKGVSCVYGGRM